MATTKDDIMGTASKTAIRTGAEYIYSLRGRNLRVYLFGELVDEPVDHPVIRPSINAIAETYDLAVRSPELGTAISPYTGERISRFLHIAESPEDLVMQNKMQRRLGQLTGTCFQRCVGMDAHGRLQFAAFGDIRNRRGSRDRLSPAICRVRKDGAATGLRHRRRHDRRQR
jgi:4-hydroxybutyryl-CoA dehydratase/vinylacetyl-CoA-Delta-isomerase